MQEDDEERSMINSDITEFSDFEENFMKDFFQIRVNTINESAWFVDPQVFKR